VKGWRGGVLKIFIGGFSCKISFVVTEVTVFFSESRVPLPGVKRWTGSALLPGGKGGELRPAFLWDWVWRTVTQGHHFPKRGEKGRFFF